MDVDSGLYHLLLPYKLKLDSQMNQPLVYNQSAMPKEQPESALGNMVADIVFNVAQNAGLSPDLAVVNYGGLRVPILDTGLLTRGNAYQLMPFDNLVVVVEVPGSILKELFDLMRNWGGWPISGAQTSMHLLEKGPAMDIYIGGSLLQDNKIYRLATSDYLAGGGDRCFFLQDLPSVHTDVLLRDAIIEHWEAIAQQGDSLLVTKEGRFKYVE
jgi:2',3'-cyclic-nucleotide 2'-phosphodiesterase (5'-nucleotidase family)